MQTFDDSTPLTLRLRRDKTTYFISCNVYESIDSLKRKLLIFNKGLQLGDLRLYHASKVQIIDTFRSLPFLLQLLDDKSNLHDQGILNNALIYFKLKKSMELCICRYRRMGINSLGQLLKPENDRRNSILNLVFNLRLYMILLMIATVLILSWAIEAD